MRNKKYRIWKVFLICIVLAICTFLISFLIGERWVKIILIVCSAVLMFCAPIGVIQYIEIQSDRIITRGSNSLNKAYNRSFTKCVFMFNDILDISVAAEKAIWIQLKDGSNVTVALGGFFKKKEITALIYEVRAQIKGYEQQYVTNDTTTK